MTLEEIQKIDLSDKNIMVLGMPTTGKTHLADLLIKRYPKHSVVRGDDFRDKGYEQSLYAAIEHIDKFHSDGPVIFEGILGYRMLRKGLQQSAFIPDVVIECTAPDWKRDEIYIKERGVEKLKSMSGFITGLRKIRADYLLAVPANQKPQWIDYENLY